MFQTMGPKIIFKARLHRMDKLNNMQMQNVTFIKWFNVGLALQNVRVLTYLPSIDFIPSPVCMERY